MIALLAILFAAVQATAAPPVTVQNPAQTPAQTPPASAATDPVPVIPVTVLARHPHDRAAFTEGLIWRGGALYESIGLTGRSEVRRVDPASGRIGASVRIPAAQFGEGLAAWGAELISLTWHDGIAHRWRASDLKPLGTRRYTGEGWGLTADATRLIQSDGSSALIFRDPTTLRETGRVTVTLRGKPLDQINELEAVDGAVLANVWHTPYLVCIDPRTGRVTAVVDLRPLVAEVAATDPEAVANGIAWDVQGRRLFVTGKLWPTMFEVRLGG